MCAAAKLQRHAAHKSSPANGLPPGVIPPGAYPERQWSPPGVNRRSVADETLARQQGKSAVENRADRSWFDHNRVAGPIYGHELGDGIEWRAGTAVSSGSCRGTHVPCLSVTESRDGDLMPREGGDGEGY